MKEEHSLAEAPASAIGTGVTTFISFMLIGVVPVLAYLIDFISDGDGEGLFFQSSILAAFAFAGIGWLKSRATRTPVLGSVIETLALGAIAAGAAYFVGNFLEPLFLG